MPGSPPIRWLDAIQPSTQSRGYDNERGVERPEGE